MKIYYQHPNTWFGDCMPFGKDDTFYLFHQRDTRVPCPFGEPFGWDLATTKDFVTYEDCGVAIPRGTDEEQDQFIFAGSVFEAEGQYHIFYTGYNRDYPALGKPSQVLMHAYSDDLVTWHKTQDALTFTPQEGYDPDDWRDPWVIRDEENDQYLLILGADYLGVGAMFPTGTKTDADSVSMEELQKIRTAVSLPIVVIGGINKGNTGRFKPMGIDGLAVVSAIIAQSDIKAAAAELKDLFCGKEKKNGF